MISVVVSVASALLVLLCAWYGDRCTERRWTRIFADVYENIEMRG